MLWFLIHDDVIMYRRGIVDGYLSKFFWSSNKKQQMSSEELITMILYSG